MIDAWLAEDPPHEVPPTIISLHEVGEQSEELRDHLAGCLVAARSNPQVVADLCDALGWESAGERVRGSRRVSVKLGDFGEVLTTEVLKHFALLEVPVPKLRYQISPEQPMYKTDILAFELNNGEILALHFVEVKLSSTGANHVAGDAHKQLRVGQEQRFGALLEFVANRLLESDASLYAALLAHLVDRGSSSDSFHISLIWERDLWQLSAIQSLPEHKDQVHPLTVRVVLINELMALVEDVYRRIDWEVDDS